MTTIPAGYITANKPLPHANHIFGTRSNLQQNAAAAIRAVAERFNPLAHMGQVHGNRVTYAEGPGTYPECDAIFTDQPDLWLAVKTADCAPVLLSSPQAVAAVHVGWRGLQAEILPKTIQALCSEFNQLPEEIHLALGPCLSQPHFEVESHFQEYFNIPRAQNFFTQNRPGHVLMDFPGLIRAQALASGLMDIHLHTLPRCTFTEEQTFHSYRRNPADQGRQISLIQRNSA